MAEDPCEPGASWAVAGGGGVVGVAGRTWLRWEPADAGRTSGLEPVAGVAGNTHPASASVGAGHTAAVVAAVGNSEVAVVAAVGNSEVAVVAGVEHSRAAVAAGVVAVVVGPQNVARRRAGAAEQWTEPEQQ